MSEPVVTPVSDNHSARISKPHPHSVAHEDVPPESRPVGQDEHGTTGPQDPPPGTSEGDNYPPQLHAGQVGYGPHFAEVHGKESGFSAKITGFKEQLKGKLTHNPDLVQKGHDRTTGELKAKEQAEDDAKSPFKGAEGGDEAPETGLEKPDEGGKSSDDSVKSTDEGPKSPNAGVKSPSAGADTRTPVENTGATGPPNAPRDVGVSPTESRH